MLPLEENKRGARRAKSLEGCLTRAASEANAAAPRGVLRRRFAATIRRQAMPAFLNSRRQPESTNTAGSGSDEHNRAIVGRDLIVEKRNGFASLAGCDVQQGTVDVDLFRRRFRWAPDTRRHAVIRLICRIA